MRKVSAYILTKDVENHIKDCIESVRWADEIVVVDSFSADATAEIAAEMGCKVVQHKFEGFGVQRNFALEQCSYEWVICLDSDERISPELRAEIEKELQNSPNGTVFVAPRKSKFINKWIMHSGWYPDYRHPVLLNKKEVKYKNQIVHEDIDYKGKKNYFKGDILHYTYDNIKQFIAKSDYYTDLRAKEMYSKGKKFHVINLIINPVAMFFKMYVFRRGFLDGLTGFILAMLYSYFYTLMKYVKLWELEEKQLTDNK